MYHCVHVVTWIAEVEPWAWFDGIRKSGGMAGNGWARSSSPCDVDKYLYAHLVHKAAQVTG